MGQSRRQLCQRITHYLHKFPQMLVLRKSILVLKVHVSHLVDSFYRLFQQLLEGGELSIQNGTVEIALDMMQVSICSR